MAKPTIIDLQGQEQDWEWLIAHYGDVELQPAEVDEVQAQVYRIVKLQAAEGPAVQVVTVRHADGYPLPGVRVVRSWPGAPELPDRLMVRETVFPESPSKAA